MHRDEVELLRINGAKERLKAGEYDVACFMAEQAVQLHLKAVILDLSGTLDKKVAFDSIVTSRKEVRVRQEIVDFP